MKRVGAEIFDPADHSDHWQVRRERAYRLYYELKADLAAYLTRPRQHFS